jgi:hypothetical protein
VLITSTSNHSTPYTAQHTQSCSSSSSSGAHLCARPAPGVLLVLLDGVALTGQAGLIYDKPVRVDHKAISNNLVTCSSSSSR